jgi:3-hydroxybutyryl-CoA dehydratase
MTHFEQIMNQKIGVINMRYEDIKIGDVAEYSKTITEKEVLGFAEISGDCNPVHIDKEFAEKSMFKKQIAHGILSGSLISTVLGTKLPGVNTIYMGQNFKFMAPVYFGDTLTARVEVADKKDEKHIIKLRTYVLNQDGKIVVDGEATVMKK